MRWKTILLFSIVSMLFVGPTPARVVANPSNTRLAVQVGSDGRFNLGAFPASPSRWDLMFHWPSVPYSSFSTVRIDNIDNVYGSTGILTEAPHDLDAHTNRSRWRIGDIEVAQIIQIVSNVQTGQADVAKIAYVVRNVGPVAHEVGSRVMIDTEINNNDGAVFRVPGKGLVTHETEMRGAEIPDTFQEFFSVNDNQHVAASTLRDSEELPPDRLVLAAWPHLRATTYNYTIDPGYDFTNPAVARPDSAYALYWNPSTLMPGGSRTYITYYGLAQLTVDLRPPLALGITGPTTFTVVDRRYTPHIFDIVATVLNSGAVTAINVQLSLSLPDELTFADSEPTVTYAIGNLAAGQERQVSWRVIVEPGLRFTDQLNSSYSVTATANNADAKTVEQQLIFPPVPPAQKLYITNRNSDQLAVLDTDTNTIVNTLPIGSGSQGVVISPNGSRAYVASTLSNQISVLDLVNELPLPPISVGVGPVIPAISPDGTRLYVTNLSSDSVSVINTATNSVITTIPNIPSPWGVAVSPDGARIAITEYSNGVVTVFDTTTFGKVRDISVGLNPEGVIYHPDGSKIYVANLTSGSISVINTAAYSASAPISVANNGDYHPVQLTFNSDATRLYVASEAPNTAGITAEIDVASNKLVRYLDAGAGPRDVEAIGQYLYVTNANDDTLSVIDLNAGSSMPIPGLHGPHSIAAGGGGTRTYVISGSVFDGHNNDVSIPISGVRISDGWEHSTITTANGSFELHGLPAGVYPLAAERDGYVFKSSQIRSGVLSIPNVQRVIFAGVFTPVIFIPGITGSRLYQQDGTPLCLLRELWPGNACNRVGLNLDPSNLFQAHNVIATDAIREITPIFQFYKPLLDTLSANGYREYLVNNNPDLRTLNGCDKTQQGSNPNLFVFAYDWRLDNAQNADLLDQYVKCIHQFYDGAKVNIVTHSMGGLLARRYILKYPGNVDKLITIAAPWLGAPKAINGLETGAFVDGLEAKIYTQLSDAEVKKLIEFFPSAHQLLPSRRYFELTGNPALKNRPIFKEALSPFGEEDWDANNDHEIASEANYTYNQLTLFLNARYPRSLPGNNSFVFHNYPSVATPDQDDWHNESSSIRYYHLYGIQSTPKTLAKLIAVNRLRCNLFADCRIDSYDPVWTLGDGTVPALSATRCLPPATLSDSVPLVDWQSWTCSQDRGYNAAGAVIKAFNSTDEKQVEHTGLARNPQVIAYVRTVLAPAPSQALTAAGTSASVKQQVTTVVAGSWLLPAKYLRINGAHSLAMADTLGNTISMVDDTLLGSIPNVTSLHLGTLSHVLVLPTDQNYSVTFQSGADPLSIDLTEKSGDTTTRAVRYLDLSLPPNVKAILQLTPQGAENLRYDADGNGSFEHSVSPTASSSGTNANDTTAPTISVNTSGPFTRTTVTLTAADSGAGVKSTLYSFDGTHYQPYTLPLSVNVLQTPQLYVFADDNLGNRSGLLNVVLVKRGYLPLTRR